MMVRRFVGRCRAASRLVSVGAAGVLVCALGSVADAQAQQASSSMHLMAGDEAPAPNRGSLLRLIEPPAIQSESGQRKAELPTSDFRPPTSAILPASGVEDGRGPKAELIEVHDEPARDEASYRRALRARAMRQLQPGASRLRTVSDEGAALSIPQPPPDEEGAPASARHGNPRTANLQAKAPDDLFAPPPAQENVSPAQGNVPPAPAPEIPNPQSTIRNPQSSPPAKSPFADEPSPQPAPAAEPPALPGAETPAAKPPADPAITPLPQNNLLEVLASSGELTVTRRRNKILRSRDNIYRVAVVDPSICDVVQFTPREVSIIGRGQGATNITFWFADGKHKPLTYLVRVVPDPEVQVERERQYEIFEEVLAELFPDSKVRLTPVADKLIVRGQARDAEEAAQILTIIRGEALAGRNGNGNGGGYNANTLIDGQAATPLSNDATGNPMPASNIVNMLRVPGVQQVALRVKIAELNRSAARHFGVNLDMQFDVGSGALILQSLLNPPGTASILGSFDNNQINFGVHYLKKHGVLRILSEPTLVTLSGRPASFVAGGEFAVPTTVGVDGAAAVTTDFRAFGVILNFLPTVLDKDRLRLEISPEFSKVNEALSVGGTPGLTTRAVTTTVEMREGQSLAIAGLLEDSMESKKEGDVPLLSTLIGKREVARNETELIILVTPELVHPLEAEEVPPLPGFDVTEPTDVQFFLGGRIEGTPTQEMRSTVWPRLRNRYRHGGPAMISGPFGHGQ